MVDPHYVRQLSRSLAGTATELQARGLLEDLFPKVTDLRPVAYRYEKQLLSTRGGALIGAELQKMVDQPARIMARSIASSAALSATRFAGPTIDLSFASKQISELYGWQAGIGDLSRRWLEPLRDFSEAMRRHVDEQGRLDEQTDEFVRAHGWPVPLHLPVRIYRRLIALATAGKREVNREMQEGFRPGTKAFAATARVLLESPAFETRRPIIEQALVAHRRRQWYLVINALLPLVEGVLVDFAFDGATPPASNRPARAIKQLRGKEGATLGIAVNTFETVLLSAGANLALFEDFEPARYGGAGEPRALNRHAILHGAARRYGSERNALRLVLLLAVMAEAFEFTGQR